MPFYLLRNEPIAYGLRRVAHEQIGIALGNARDASMPQDARVHSLRTRCKKLRGLIRLVPLPMGEAFEFEDQRFRAASQALAAHRERHVLAMVTRWLDDQESRPTDLPDATSADAIGQALAILTACDKAVDSWPLDICGFADIAPGFSRTYRKSKHAYEVVLNDPEDNAFHHLRKRAKYHWYQVRFLERLNKPRIRSQRKKLRKLHLTLGEAHDLAVLQALLESQDKPDSRRLHGATDRKNRLYADALKQCRSIFTQSADELVADYARWYCKSR